MKNLQPKDINESSIYYQHENENEEPTEWEQVTEINNKGFGIVLVGDYYGAVNIEGEIIIPFQTLYRCGKEIPATIHHKHRDKTA